MVKCPHVGLRTGLEAEKLAKTSLPVTKSLTLKLKVEETVPV